MVITNEELFKVTGGAIEFSSSLLNSIVNLVKTVLDIGRAIGSSISRYKNKKYC